MNILLPEDWQRFVREEVRSGHFSSEAAVIEEVLALLKQREHARDQQNAANKTGAKPIGEIIDELMKDVPAEVLDRLPVDGAAQHDHHVYGLPKRLMNRAFADTVYRIAQQLVLVGSRPLVLPMPRRRGSIKFDANLCTEKTAMLDIHSDINSLSNFKRNTPEFLRQLKETGHPVVLTINGKAELVVQDAASYQKLIEIAERAERMEALQASIADMRAGKVSPVEDLLAEMRKILAEKQGR